MKRWAFMVAVAMLLTMWGSLQLLSHGEPVLSKKPFTEFPLSLSNQWQGKELGLSQDTLDVLKLTDYMMRVYVRRSVIETDRPARGPVPVFLYVGYYQSQRTGATYHSPKNCLPGAGWQFVESQPAVVMVPGGRAVTINKVMIQKGLEKQAILYWYHDRGRVVASEYWAKAYLMWDAMTKNRTDGALVRISLPVAGSVEDTYQEGLAFLQDLWPILDEYLPDAHLKG
jgi:EpsI family protein